MQEYSQDQFSISNSVLLSLKIAEGSLGVTVPTAQGGDPCDSTTVKFRAANGHIPQPPRDCRLTWISWWHLMSL